MHGWEIIKRQYHKYKQYFRPRRGNIPLRVRNLTFGGLLAPLWEHYWIRRESLGFMSHLIFHHEYYIKIYINNSPTNSTILLRWGGRYPSSPPPYHNDTSLAPPLGGGGSSFLWQLLFNYNILFFFSPSSSSPKFLWGNDPVCYDTVCWRSNPLGNSNQFG